MTVTVRKIYWQYIIIYVIYFGGVLRMKYTSYTIVFVCAELCILCVSVSCVVDTYSSSRMPVKNIVCVCAGHLSSWRQN